MRIPVPLIAALAAAALVGGCGRAAVPKAAEPGASDIAAAGYLEPPAIA